MRTRFGLLLVMLMTLLLAACGGGGGSKKEPTVAPTQPPAPTQAPTTAPIETPSAATAVASPALATPAAALGTPVAVASPVGIMPAPGGVATPAGLAGTPVVGASPEAGTGVIVVPPVGGVVAIEASPQPSPVASPVASPMASPAATPAGAILLHGLVTLPGTVNEAYVLTDDGCAGLGADADLKVGRQVVVRDEAGRIIGVTELRASDVRETCAWTFAVEVPASAFYAVSIPMKTERVYTYEEVVSHGGEIELPVR